MENKAQVEAIHKLNRIGRYLLDHKEFAAFDVTSKAMHSIVADLKAQRKADREFARAFSPNKYGEYA